MAWLTFGTQTSPLALSKWDTQFANVAQWATVDCSATGTNVITLTPTLSGYTGPSYANYVSYRFVAANSSSGSVTARIGALGAIKVYKSDGTTQIGSGGVVAARAYSITYNSALDSGAGGWLLTPIGEVVQSITGVSQSPPGGRLTLATDTPVLITSQSAKTTVYYALYNSNLIPYYDGAAWATTTFTELSVALDSNAGHAGYQQSGKNFDIFFDYNSGSGRIVTGPAWTSDTARADALTRLNGIWVNNASIVVKFDSSASTATIGANLLTYLGTMRGSANGQCQYIFGASAAGGTAAAFYLWNCYNRILTATTVTDSTNNWTYTTATVASLNASATNRVSLLTGLAEDAILVSCMCLLNQTALGAIGYVGYGLDSTTAYTKNAAAGGAVAAVNNYTSCSVAASLTPQIGFHYVQALQLGDGTNATTYYGGIDEGLTVTLRN